MENKIICPACNQEISNNPVIDAAANGDAQEPGFIICECGERITYWAITAQLRDQKTMSRKIQNWFLSLFKKPAPSKNEKHGVK